MPSQAAQLAAALQHASASSSNASVVSNPLTAQQPSASVQSHLLELAGDHVVKKRLVVMNSENELQYYLRTGSIPSRTTIGR